MLGFGGPLSKSMKKFHKFSVNLVIVLTALSFQAGAGDYSAPPAKSLICDPDEQCVYIFAYGGVSLEQNIDSSLTIPGPGINPVFFGTDMTRTDDGVIFGGGVGKKSCFLGGSRFEFEGLYSENSISQITNPLSGGGFANNIHGDLAVGDVEIYALMVNFLKEFPIGKCTAYAGIGIGYANVGWEIEDATTGFNPPEDFSGDDGAFAHQFIVGLDVPVSDRMALFLQYKALGVGETTPVFLNGIHTVDSFYTQSVSAGLRVCF